MDGMDLVDGVEYNSLQGVRFPPMKIAHKMIISVVLVVTVLLVISALIIGSVTSASIIEHQRNFSANLIPFLKHEMKPLMFTKQFPILFHHLEKIKENFPDLVALTLLKPDGTVVASSMLSSEGTKWPIASEECMTCHSREPLRLKMSNIPLSRVVTTPGSVPAVRVVSTIENEPGCYNASCHFHPKSQKMLGILFSDFDYRPTRRLIHHQYLIIASLTMILIILISITMSYVVSRLVDRPLKEIIQAMTRVSHGKFDVTLPTTQPGSREMLQLRESFQDMTLKLDSYYRSMISLQTYLSSIVENTSDIIITIDNRLLIETFNRGAEQLLGYTREEVIGKPLHRFFLEQSDIEALLKAIDNEAPPYSREIRWRTRKGDSLVVLVTCSRFYDERHGHQQYIVSAKDISEYKELTERLTATKTHAAIGLAAVQITHGIKNILNSLQGGEYRIESALKKNNIEKVSDAWSDVKEAIGRLTHFTHDLLTFTRPTQIQVQQVKLKPLLEDTVNAVKQKASSKQCHFEIDYACDIETMALDPHAMYQVMLNLLDNAVDACEDKEESTEQTTVCPITVRVRSSGTTLTIDITDRGKGMPEELLEQIFTPFFSTKLDAGNGLGLPLAREVVEAHEGKLTVQSQVGAGSTFTIQLPMRVHETQES